MSRRLVVPLAALAALLVPLAATNCGVPGHTGVVVDGEGSNPYVGGGGYAEGPPPGPDGTGNSIDEFVKRFLEQPAGDWEGAAARVRRFLSPEAQGTWQAPKEITVIRLVNGRPEIKSGPSYEVVLKVQQIGVLTNKGTLEPPGSQADVHRYAFTVGTSRSPTGGFQVVNPPPVMLLTDTALNHYYAPRTLYFWDANHNLVPDLRYLPKTVDNAGAARPILLIDWLIGGPSEWLRAGVTELPDGTKQLRNAYIDDGRLIVNLNDAAAGQSLDDLLIQLCWSLHDDFTGKLVLQIESVQQREGTFSDYLDRNQAFRLIGQGAQQFAIAGGAAGGVVRRVQAAGAPVSADVPLSPTVNKNVRFAAISTKYAALVRHDGDQLRLWAGSTRPQKVDRTGLRAHTMSRPVLASDRDTGYVAADGKLYRFNADTGQVTMMAIPGLPAEVTAVALAPDARRLAIVADGKPYLVGLIGEGGASAGSPRPVPSPLAGLTGITWLNETSIAVTGANRGKAALARVSLDGAVLANGGLQELNASAVTELVSFPENPVSGSGGRIMIEEDGKTYEVYSSTIEYLPPERLAGPPAKGAVLVAPFFME